MSMAEIIVVGCFISIIWSLVAWVIMCLIYTNGEPSCDFFNPYWIYTHVPVNIIGCILLTIVIHVLNPIIAIGYWIYKICTVGRKY